MAPARFFLSLEDDLMKTFAGQDDAQDPLSKLGHEGRRQDRAPACSRSAVGKAQRKVEERNFLIRKQILEYDEVMDHQRHKFYGLRQEILEGRGIDEVIFDFIELAAADACGTYLDRGYVGSCIAEWVHENLGVSIEGDRFRNKDRADLREFVVTESKQEATSMIQLAMGEFMSEEVPQEEWDLKALADWAAGHFGRPVQVSDLLGKDKRPILLHIETIAHAAVDEADLDPLDRYLVKHYGEKELQTWCRNKFGAELDVEKLASRESEEAALDLVMEEARAAYRQRELRYPIEHAIQATGVGLQQAAAQAQDDEEAARAAGGAVLAELCRWVKFHYDLDWSPDALPSTNSEELANILLAEAESWDDERVANRARAIVEEAGGDVEAFTTLCAERLGFRLTEEEQARAATDPQGIAEEKVRGAMRVELTQFERAVLLQIIDASWKDHLYAVDQLRESIGYRTFSQRDPRIEFKREAARLYEEMEETIRNQVTDIVYRGRPQFRPQVPPAAVAQARAAAEAQAAGQPGGPGAATSVATAGGGATATAAPPAPEAARPATSAVASAVEASRQQREDLETAEQAGVPDADRPKARPVRRPGGDRAERGRPGPGPVDRRDAGDEVQEGRAAHREGMADRRSLRHPSEKRPRRTRFDRLRHRSLAGRDRRGILDDVNGAPSGAVAPDVREARCPTSPNTGPESVRPSGVVAARS